MNTTQPSHGALRTWIELSEGALRNNLKLFYSLAGKHNTVPVVKSNAYGHGLEETWGCIRKETPLWLAVNYISEAETLRRLGFEGRVMVVGTTPPEQLARALEARAEMVVGDAVVLKHWLACGSKPTIHVKFDTGMSRQGFLPEEAGAIADQLLPHKKLVAGISTHFANVEDVLEREYADTQLRRFSEARKSFADKGLKVMSHASSSASTLLMPEARLDLCRIGISLYGLWPSQATRLSYLQTFGNVAELKPALSWKSLVASVRPVNAGQFIGYGCTYRALKDMRVAVIPVGYYEGFPRLAGNAQAYMLIRGQRCPVIGRVCMNMLMLDVSHLPTAEAGDTVTLIGTDANETITASDVAAWAQTIHYELATRLLPAIPRQIVA
jgi:alanine racemase